MANVHVLDHPLIQHKVTLIRDSSTGSKEFRELVEEVALLMTCEVTRDLPSRRWRSEHLWQGLGQMSSQVKK